VRRTRCPARSRAGPALLVALPVVSSRDVPRPQHVLLEAASGGLERRLQPACSTRSGPPPFHRQHRARHDQRGRHSGITIPSASAEAPASYPPPRWTHSRPRETLHRGDLRLESAAASAFASSNLLLRQLRRRCRSPADQLAVGHDCSAAGGEPCRRRPRPARRPVRQLLDPCAAGQRNLLVAHVCLLHSLCMLQKRLRAAQGTVGLQKVRRGGMFGRPAARARSAQPSSGRESMTDRGSAWPCLRLALRVRRGPTAADVRASAATRRLTVAIDGKCAGAVTATSLRTRRMRAGFHRRDFGLTHRVRRVRRWDGDCRPPAPRGHVTLVNGSRPSGHR